MLAESEGDLQRVVNEFYSVCKRRKLKVNAGKSKVVFERREEEVVDFNTACRVRLPAVARCRVMLGSEKMEEVSIYILFILRPAHRCSQCFFFSCLFTSIPPLLNFFYFFI